MNKILIALILFVGISFSQTMVYELNFGTLANSVTETGYQKFDGWKSIDSISVGLAGTGEVDVDSVDIYVGYMIGSGSWFSTTANTFISTMDLGAGVKLFLPLALTGNISIKGALLRGGMNAVKVVTRGAVSGNDPTDPNNLRVLLTVHGTR